MKDLDSRLESPRKWLESHHEWPLRECTATEVVLLHLNPLTTWN